MTPRSGGFGGGSGTPRAAGSAVTPRSSGYPGGTTPGTPRQRDARTPQAAPQPSPGGAGRPQAKSRGGNMWGDVAADWAAPGGGSRERGGERRGGQGGDRRREGGQLPHFINISPNSCVSQDITARRTMTTRGAAARP